VPLPGPSRYDAWTWAAGIAALAGGTGVAYAAGARLGAALTLGVGLLVAVVVVALGAQEIRRRRAGGRISPESRPPRGRATRRRRR
jgi:hypothetical protein